EVTFDIDANGIVHVTAKDKGTGKENTIKIQDGSGLSQEEIDRMVKDAELHAEEDKKRREEQETRNNAESMVYQTRKFVEENSEKVSEDIKTKVEEAAKAVEEALKGEDLEAIKAAVEKLSTESQEMGKAIYEADANAGATQAQAADDATSADDNVVDAEVVEDETGTEEEKK
ncbi:MAG: Hsp70 family protein, partial [Corynebacterium marinum]|nr:Hsp70 family protein [Corynebacterium marinum]